jgi:hypothetical protein
MVESPSLVFESNFVHIIQLSPLSQIYSHLDPLFSLSLSQYIFLKKLKNTFLLFTENFTGIEAPHIRCWKIKLKFWDFYFIISKLEGFRCDSLTRIDVIYHYFYIYKTMLFNISLYQYLKKISSNIHHILSSWLMF